MESESQIGNFYKDQSVFITGASGFIGKVLVEKLLRSCGGVKHIYVLLRPKKGIDVSLRLKQLLDVKIFDNIRDSEPKILNKVLAIEGDITLPGLGISDIDLRALVRDVSIVFHSAATTKFDEPLKIALNLNVLGTRRLLELCHQLPKIVAVIHVSTAYANCNRYEVDEQLYPLPVPPQKIIDMCEWMSDDMVDALTPSLLEDRPNTYTYTKALAETLLVNECGSLPVAIVRPSIVTPSWKEPLPGWVDNLNGATGIFAAGYKGIVRHMRVKSSLSADIIPVDAVINLMIALVWFTSTQRPKGILIYNCTSGSLNRISWKQMMHFMLPVSWRYPSEQVFRYPSFSLQESQFFHKLCILFDHTIPAYLSDALMLCFGRKPNMVKLYERIHRSAQTLGWFTSKEWLFSSSNVLMLNDHLKQVDKQIFHFDIRDIHWPTYLSDYVLGIRLYIFKENNNTLPGARKNLRRIYFLSKFIDLLVLLGVCYIFYLGSFILDMF